MALKLATTEKGIAAEYWKIIQSNVDYRKNSTQCVLALYVDQAHREAGVNNWLRLEPFQFDGIDLTREEMYNMIIESKLEDKVVSEAVEEVKDAKGKVVTPAVEEIVEKVEINKWAASESIMEVIKSVESIDTGKVEVVS